MQPPMSDRSLPGYTFWYDPLSALPYRWAAHQVQRYDKRHGTHHGGARTGVEAHVAAERHAYQVASNAHLHQA